MEKFININQFNGSSYDKILPDNASLATKQMYGLNGNNTTDDVLAWLGEYNEHWWRRRSVSASFSKTTITQKTIIVQSSYELYIEYSNEISYSTIGIVLVNPSTVYFSSSTIENISNITPCYFKVTTGISEDKIYYLPEGSTGGKNGFATVMYNSQPHWYLDASAAVKGQIVDANVSYGSWEFVSSMNRNSYPDEGIIDGYEYEYIGIPFDKLPSAAKIETGSYIGTGTNDRITLTFDFAPQIVLIYTQDISYGRGAMLFRPFIKNMPLYGNLTTDIQTYHIETKWTGDGVSCIHWRRNGTYNQQSYYLNASIQYNYIALG